MSKGEFAFFSFLVMLVFAAIFIDSRIQQDFENRLTKMEQSQCAVKESKDHADYKLNRCMEQLR